MAESYICIPIFAHVVWLFFSNYGTALESYSIFERFWNAVRVGCFALSKAVSHNA